MKDIIEQFINQLGEDQKLSNNTKFAYKSDLNDLIDYVVLNNSQIADLNHTWVKDYLKHLEEINKERNSFNRRASTFRLFLRFLYKNKLAPTNYSLIVDNQSPFFKTKENEDDLQEIKKIIEETKLQIEHKLIILFISRLGLTATQIASLNTFQVDFETKSIELSDTEKFILPYEIFTLLREYLINTRQNVFGSSEHLNLFLNEKGKPYTDSDIYRLIKNLSDEVSPDKRISTRSLKKLSEKRFDVMAIQKELFGTFNS